MGSKYIGSPLVLDIYVMHAQNIIIAFIILYRPFIKMLISNDKLKVYMSSSMARDVGALDTANWLRGYTATLFCFMNHSMGPICIKLPYTERNTLLKPASETYSQ